MKTVFFRADSNAKIASGHIMRCLSIANQFRQAGFSVCFITADALSDGMLEGFKHIILNTEWDNLAVELPQMKELLGKCEEKPILFIDTYSITAEYTEALSQFATIVYLGSKRGYLGHLDYQINYCAKTEPEYYASLYGDRTKLLLGLLYTPLREEFRNIADHTKDCIQRVLITTGNTDAIGCVPMILTDIFKESYSTNIVYDVVVGSMFNHLDELESLAYEHPNILLHRNVKKMSDLMKNADLAITAAGNTILELAAARVPQIAFSMVEEQTRSAKEFEELRMIEYVGEMYVEPTIIIYRICESIRKYAFSKEERFAMSNRAAAYVDGRGCERIVSTLIDSHI